MSEYLVEWQIELSAISPEQAAMAALSIQRNPLSMATVFDMIDEDGEKHRVDLLETQREYWEDHPEFTSEDWKYETMNGDTRLGYWEWVNKKEQEYDSVD